MSPTDHVERIAISTIVVGMRRRQKLGNLKSLAKSIEAHGLLHPILVRNGHELIAGQRRLEACKFLGWPTIPARDVTGCDDEELRAIELTENTEREALNDYEASKARLAEIRAQAEAEFRSRSDRKGRPVVAASQRSVAAAVGVGKTTVQKLERHVDLAEQYPVFKRPEWRQHHVLEAGEKLRALPEKERQAVTALLDQPAIPPKDAIRIVENVVQMTPAARARIYTMAKSHDAHVRQNALAAAAKLPPEPNPGLLILAGVERDLRRAAREIRHKALEKPITALARGVAVVIKKAEKALEIPA